jgi:dTDP-4-dehydrorhamnose 3,5-epimerase-like enzyme
LLLYILGADSVNHLTFGDFLLEQRYSPLSECKIINFPVVHDVRGNLSFIEENRQIPFQIKRVYYLYDVPSGATRGGHAHKALHQVVIALSGSFEIILDDGYNKRSFFLNRPHYGIYIPPRVWRELENFSSNSVALSLVSEVYDESDYIRNYDAFKSYVYNGWQ